MPVDVVGDQVKVNIQDLKIVAKENSRLKFDLNLDVSKDQWDELIKRAKEGATGLGLADLGYIAAICFLTGKITKEEMSNSLWTYLDSNNGIDSIFALYILDTEKLSKKYPTKESRVDHYNFTKEVFLDPVYEPTSYIRLLVFGTVYKDLFNNDKDFKEIARATMFEDLKNKLPSGWPIAIQHAAFRVAFPEEDIWKENLKEDDWQELKESIKEADIGLVAEEALAGYILAADSVSVNHENGLVIEYHKNFDQEKPLPERRKY